MVRQLEIPLIVHAFYHPPTSRDLKEGGAASLCEGRE